MADTDNLLIHYLTWKIKIQLLAMQISKAKHEGLKEWQPILLQTITEMHNLAACYGPFNYHQPPPEISPLYPVHPVNGGCLFETVSRGLENLFGSVANAGTLRIEP